MLYMEATPSDVYDCAVRLGRAEQLGDWYGINALYEYYSELSDMAGEPIVVDIIGWCCDWTYYDSLEDARADGIDPHERIVLPVQDGDGCTVGYLVSNS